MDTSKILFQKYFSQNKNNFKNTSSKNIFRYLKITFSCMKNLNSQTLLVIVQFYSYPSKRGAYTVNQTSS